MPNGRPLLLGIELRGTGVHPAAWRRGDSRAEELFTAGYWVDGISAAEKAGVDLAFIPDSFALRQGGHDVERGQLDAVAITARSAATTHTIGLIPEVSVTHTEPFHVSKAIASVDFASRGRAGWEVSVSEGDSQARLFGRKAAQDEASLWAEADDAIEVVTRLWDSWEDDAEIRDQATGRFIDRSKLHYIDFIGANFSVKGPSITPRSPQGQPLVVVRASGPASRRVALARADLIRISAPDLTSARIVGEQIRTDLVQNGRRVDDVTVLLDLEVHLAISTDAAVAEVEQLDKWALNSPASARFVGTTPGLVRLLSQIHDAGAADGVVLQPLAVSGTVAQLSEGLGSYSATPATLRDKLGLLRPANRFAEHRG